MTDDLQNRFRIAARQSRELMERITKDAHSEWMDQCVPELMDHGKDQIVAIAACLNMWRQAWEESHPDGADDPGPSRPGHDKDEQKTLRLARRRLRGEDSY